MKVAQVRAVLFAKDLEGLTAFYAGALGMTQSFADADHAVLHCGGFELIVHRIPKHIAATMRSNSRLRDASEAQSGSITP